MIFFFLSGGNVKFSKLTNDVGFFLFPNLKIQYHILYILNLSTIVCHSRNVTKALQALNAAISVIYFKCL